MINDQGEIKLIIFMEVKKMKSKKIGYSLGRTVLIAMMCLIIGTLGSTSVFAATGDIQDKGWDRLLGGSMTDVLNGVVATSDGGFIAIGSTVDNPINFQDQTVGDTDGMVVKTDHRGTVIWNKFVGGNGNDELNAIVKLSDGSLLVAGTSTSSANGDIQDTNSGAKDGLLVKYNSNGDLLWTKLIGGSKDDIFYDVITTTDGGFLVAGYSDSTASGKITDTNNGNGTYDGYIVKFDSDGNVQWDNLFGSPEYDVFHSVIQTSDGGYIAVGNANGGAHGTNTGGEITDIPDSGLMPNDALLVKFDASGAMVWNDLFGGSGHDIFYCVIPVSDGGFAAVGSTFTIDGDITNGVSGQINALAVKFNSSGIAQWNRAFTAGGYPKFQDVIETTDGSLIAAGTSITALYNGRTEDGFISKIGSSGSVLDYIVVGGNGADGFNALTMDQSGHIFAVGKATSSQSGMILSKTNGGQDGLLSYFGESMYNVTFNENGGTNLADQVIAFGNRAAVPQTFQKSGYTFEGWYLDAGLSEPFSLSAPIIQDTTLYAKWYKHITMDSIISDNLNIKGAGEPGLRVVASFANGTKLDTTVKSDGLWTIALPKGFGLNAGTKVVAAMYDNSIDGVEVSSTEKVIIAAATPPKTGDIQDLFPVWVFGMFLGLIIMRRAFKGPKVRRRY